MSKEHNEFLRAHEEDLGKGKRSKRFPAGQPQRMNLNESSESIDLEIPLIISPSDNDSASSGSDSDFEVSDQKKKGKPDFSSDDEDEKIETNTIPLSDTLQSYFSQLGSVYEELKGKNETELGRICGFEEVQRIKFLEFTLKMGIVPFRIEDVYKR